MFTPVRRIVETHRITDTGFFFHAVFFNRFSPDPFHFSSSNAGFYYIQRSVKSLYNDLTKCLQFFTWDTDDSCTCQWSVRTPVTSGKFNNNVLSFLECLICPSQVTGRSLFPCWQ